MSFVEIDVFGVLISPIMPLMALAFAMTMGLRWVAVTLGWARLIWHPALFEFSIFLIVLTTTVLIFGDLRSTSNLGSCACRRRDRLPGLADGTEINRLIGAAASQRSRLDPTSTSAAADPCDPDGCGAWGGRGMASLARLHGEALDEGRHVVRAYVVTLAPEVSGQVTELAVNDNQFVHKGDLLMKLDPRDYKVAIELGKAAVDQPKDYENKKVQAEWRLALTDLATSREER